MIKLSFKYFTLFFFLLIIILFTQNYFDHSPTVYLIFIIPFILILILLNLIILYSFDYSHFKRKRGDFKKTNKVVLGLFIILLIHFSLFYYMEKKEVLLNGVLENNKGELILYKNHTFKIHMQWNHGSDNYLGNYEINDYGLNLKRDDLEELTGYNFTNEYLIFEKERKIISKKENFKNLIIE